MVLLWVLMRAVLEVTTNVSNEFAAPIFMAEISKLLRNVSNHAQSYTQQKPQDLKLRFTAVKA
jgi:hypothetical protein